jgi:FKBP-type peptidyl-prolyl cis-trans isomerase FkpA
MRRPSFVRTILPRFACLSLAFAPLFLVPFFMETAVAADAEVPHPQLPAGAGALDADAPKTFQTTPSGLQYRVLRKGAGAQPKATNSVKVNYHGWLDDGKVFDSSYKRGEAIEFGLNQVIPGWTEGMQLVGKGGMIELVIPSKLGYGPRGTPGGPIPPNATLHFLVELLDVR